VAEDAVAGPSGEADFADELGSDPGGRFCGLRCHRERRGLHLEGSEAIPEVAEGLVIEAGADLSAMDETTRVEHGQDECAQLV
jgi:hypothetical protein